MSKDGYDNADDIPHKPENGVRPRSGEQSPTAESKIHDYGAVDKADSSAKNNGVNPWNRDPSLTGSQVTGLSLRTQSEPDPELDLPCSWGPFSPQFCQICRNSKVVLICLCVAAAVQGMVVNGFINVSVSSLEQRYDLSSTESGLIVSTYDIASVLSLIPVTYLGGIGRKPRWLGIGMGVLALGSFIFALPQFTTADYRSETGRADALCHLTADNTSDHCDGRDSGLKSLSNYKYLFIFANILHGVGAAPLYTLGVTYLDENLSTAASPLYLGIFYMTSIVGPAVGYLLGGQFLDIYVDVNTGSPRGSLDPDNPNWVGAWWIGFLLAGTLAIAIALPLCGFPRDLPGSQELRAQKVSEAYAGSDVATSNPEFGLTIKDIPASFKILVFNPTFMCLNLAAASEGMIVGGLSAFAPKFIQAQFSLTSGWAATLVGLVAIPTGGGGMFIGGFLTKKLKLNFPGMVKMCLSMVVVSLLGSLCFLSHCANVDFAGVNVNYGTHNHSMKSYNLTAECNAECYCLRRWYEPVCGGDDVMYYSPCHAGCLNSFSKSESKVYSDCTCISDTGIVGGDEPSYQAEEGTCDSGCTPQLTVYLIVFAVAMLATFISAMPALSATLRCVPEKQRSFALGIQWIFARCLGTIPAPILFGVLIDRSCLLWQEECGEQGSCYFYNNFDQSISLMGLALSFKALSLLFFTLSFCLYRPPEIIDDVMPEMTSCSSRQNILDDPKTRGSHLPNSNNFSGLSNPGLQLDDSRESGSNPT